MTPLVSVVIPSYNSSKTVLRSLESVRAQNFDDIEIVVVDDASSDSTVDVIRGAWGNSVRLLRSSKNRGAAAARDAGVAAARGRYIAFLDSDDRWLPGKLEAQLEVLESSPQVTLVSCDALIVDQDGKPRHRSHERKPPLSGADAWQRLLAYNFIPTPTVVARRGDIIRAGAFDPGLVVGEDLDLWIRLGIMGEIRALPQMFVEVFEQPSSLMKRYAARQLEIVIPMVERYLQDQRQTLTSDQLRAIRGQRMFAVAATLFHERHYGQSIYPFLRAARLRHRTLRSLFNIPRAAIREYLTHRNSISREGA
jgi:glycosyltransferase involved in cell wall biosynthesis